MSGVLAAILSTALGGTAIVATRFLAGAVLGEDTKRHPQNSTVPCSAAGTVAQAALLLIAGWLSP